MKRKIITEYNQNKNSKYDKHQRQELYFQNNSWQEIISVIIFIKYIYP